jgi:hypothetical protein
VLVDGGRHAALSQIRITFPRVSPHVSGAAIASETDLTARRMEEAMARDRKETSETWRGKLGGMSREEIEEFLEQGLPII